MSDAPPLFSSSLPLLIDASGPIVHVGIPSPEGWRALCSDEKPALESLFISLRKCLGHVDSHATSIDALRAKGHTVKVVNTLGAAQAIGIGQAGKPFTGSPDPRNRGVFGVSGK